MATLSMLDIKRKELELTKVVAARAELEFRVMEREEEIERLKSNIEIQLAKESQLKEEIKKAKS